eukprot:scaffold21216_cov60-Phaeocystis_antarctica.AAC.2
MQAGCSSLVELILPATLEYIGEGAFQGCSSLTKLAIPAAVTSIGHVACYGAPETSSPEP